MRRLLSIAILLFLSAAVGRGQTTIPATFSVFGDDFEGTLENWGVAPGSVLSIEAAAAHSGSGGLEVTVSHDESHLIRGGSRDLTRADEAYLTFWFHPSGVVFNDGGSGFVPGRSLQIAAIQGPEFKNLVAIRFRDVGGSYEGFIEWRDASDTGQWDYASGSFSIADAWQEITIGFRRNEWVAAWIGGVNVRSVTSGVNHYEPYASVAQVGKTLTTNPSLINPSGVLKFDEVDLLLPRITDLWVDGASGSDSFDGLTPGTAFATISRASDLAGAGTTVHIQPGTYRETVVPAQGGISGEPAVFRAESGPGTVQIRGSERSADLTWTQLASDTIGLPGGVSPGSIWWTDLSAWNLAGAPRFLVRTDPSGTPVLERFPLAREPDWTVPTPYKHSQRWWVADGGDALPGCDPTTDPDPDCDLPSRSSLQLIDTTSDGGGAEPGHLASLGSLIGATLVARDARLGHYQYRRGIAAHDVGAGRITVDSACFRAGTDPGLGWGVQYYVENLPTMLDTPGEWWYDETDGKLYFWPPTPGNPQGLDLEISRHPVAFELINISHLSLEDLDLELFNDVLVDNRNFIWHSSVGNTVTGCRLRWADSGIVLRQQIEPGEHADKRVEGFLVENNEISHQDFNSVHASYFWPGGAADDWVRPGVFDLVIRGNEIHDAGFRTPDGANSPSNLVVQYADRLTIEDNWIHDVAHDGIMIQQSVVQSPDTWGFSSAEIKTGEILVRNNVIEGACQLKNDCGALKIWGLAPDHHVYRDLLVFGNTLRDTFGWSWPAEQRGILSVGQIPGTGASGLYLDHTSGVAAYRNVLYNNGLAGAHLIKTWRDGPVLLYNNVVADNVFGLRLAGLAADTHLNVDTRIRNNILVNNETYGLLLADLDSDYTNTFIDRNLYHANGWRDAVFKPGAMKIDHGGSAEYHQTLAEIQASTGFEASGQSADPVFLGYDLSDHDPLDGSAPDFRLESGSPAEDAGTTILPAALDDLLTLFSVSDSREGPRFDQGAFEGTVVCGDLTVENQEVPSSATFETCDTLTLGPALEVTNDAILTAIAGRKIVFVNGYSMEAGASLEAIDGQFP